MEDTIIHKDGTKEIILRGFQSNVTPEELKNFTKWALRNGFEKKQIYKFESIKRAYRLVSGDLSVMCYNRTILPESKTNKYGHRKGKNIVMLDCDISCYLGGMNLGQYGIQWQHIAQDDLDFMIPRLVPERVHQGMRY